MGTLQYLNVMMSKASPAANSAEAGTAQTWFKVYEQKPTYANGQLTFPSESEFFQRLAAE